MRKDISPPVAQARVPRKRTAAMKAALHLDMTMDEIMRRWPGTIRVVIRNGMLCVGCPIAPFHTVSDAAREHGLDDAALRRALEAAASSGAEPTAPMPSPSGLRQAPSGDGAPRRSPSGGRF